MRKKVLYATKVACGTALALSLASTGALAASAEQQMMMELKKLIEQQQTQLAKQAKEIEELQKSIGGMNVAMEEKATKEELKAIEGSAAPNAYIKSKFDNVDVSVYGQINKAIMFADNGSSSKTYFVDNSNSSSRIGLAAKVGVSEDFSVGGKFEYDFQSNASSKIDEDKDSVSADFNLRHADMFFASETYGKLSLGKGSMAADGTSEVDLSGTSLVAYSAVSDMAGGQLWYDGATTPQNGDLKIGNVFSNFDGGREDRIRYDSPSYYGFSAAVAAATDDKYDLALRYSRDYEMAKVASAVAYQSAGNDGDVDDIFNGSVSILLNNGLNFTLAGGVQSSSESNRDDASFYGGKIGYQANIFQVGTTNFSLDYFRNEDVWSSEAAYAKGGEADAWALAVVQNVPDWGTDFYFAFRQYMYDSDAENYDDINVVMTGARLKF